MILRERLKDVVSGPTVPIHRDVIIIEFLTPCSGYVARAGALVMALGRTPDADDPPYETRGCGVGSCSVSSAIFFWDSDSG